MNDSVDLYGFGLYGHSEGVSDFNWRNPDTTTGAYRTTTIFPGWDLRSIYPDLKKIEPSSQVVFVSADPQRDDSARLKSYTAFFHPEFKAATGPHRALFPLVRNLGLVYSIVESERKDYLIDHSASIVLISPAGRPWRTAHQTPQR